MYMNKEDWTVAGVLLTAVGGIIGLVVWSVVYMEIDSTGYNQLHYWSEKCPEVRLMVEEASWEDNKIDQVEFREIKSIAIPLLLKDARGENDVHE